MKGTVYGKQNFKPHLKHDLSSLQAGHPALVGEENRQNRLPCVCTFQRNQHGNDGGQNQTLLREEVRQAMENE